MLEGGGGRGRGEEKGEFSFSSSSLLFTCLGFPLFPRYTCYSGQLTVSSPLFLKIEFKTELKLCSQNTKDQF